MWVDVKTQPLCGRLTFFPRPVFQPTKLQKSKLERGLEAAGVEIGKGTFRACRGEVLAGLLGVRAVGQEVAAVAAEAAIRAPGNARTRGAPTGRTEADTTAPTEAGISATPERASGPAEKETAAERAEARGDPKLSCRCGRNSDCAVVISH